MFDDGGRGSGLGRFAWFQLGRMSAESSQRDLQTLDLVRDSLAGRRPVTVDQSYIDDLTGRLSRANAEIDKANDNIRAWMAEVASWKSHASQWEEYAKILEDERDLLKTSEQSAQKSDERHYSALQNQRNAVANLRYFATHLQRFAALGLANEPEYEQLALRQRAAWTNFISDPTLTEIGDTVKNLVDALERKLPR